MAYRILYTKTAAKDIGKLDRVVKNKIQKKIEAFSKKPLYYSKRLTNSKMGTYRFRAGNYRIVFDMDKNTVVILRVGHRREIYKQ